MKTLSKDDFNEMFKLKKSSFTETNKWFSFLSPKEEALKNKSFNKNKSYNVYMDLVYANFN